MEKDSFLKLYYNMLRIRMVEEKIAELYSEWEMRCPVHLCIGQEAIATGVCANLSREDYLLSNHRSHGHYLAKGGDLKAMISEIYGKETGCSSGKGGSMHLIDLSVNILGTTPVVASIIPVAVGVAFGAAMKEENKITVIFFGDGSTEEGVFCESLNFAALKKLPVIFVCENNFFSVYSPLSVRQPGERDNLTLARAYGIKSAKGDGNNVLEVYHMAKEAVSYVKKGMGPYYLEFDTYRWLEHCGHNYDNHIGYRTEEEFLKWRKRCPIETYEKYIIQKGIIHKQNIEKFRQDIQSEIEDAFTFAKSSLFPKTENISLNIYATN